MKRNWEYKKLGDVCDSLTGLWTGKKEPFVNVAVIRNTNFSKDCKLKLDDVAYLDVEQKQYSTRKLLPGDIIVEKSGGSDKQPVGRVVLFDIPKGEFSFSNFTGTLRIKNKRELNSRFLHRCLFAHYLRGETRKLQSKTTGLHNLDMKGYLKLPIPVPPLEEQSRIVAELDLLTGIIDKQNAQLKELDNLAQAIFYDMFGDSIENPKGWEIQLYGDCFDIGSGGTPSKSNDSFWNAGDIPWIGSNLCQNCVISHTDGKYITKMGLEHSNTKFLETNTVLVALVGATIGKVGLLKTKTAINQNIAFIRCIWGKRFFPEYVFYQLMGLYPLFMNIGNGDFKMANLSFVRNLPIEIPPLPLQQSFAQKIQSIEKQKETIRASIADTQKLLDYTMDKYFG